MIKMESIDVQGGKIIIVKADDLFRYELRDASGTPLQWKRVAPREDSRRTSPRCFAIVTGKVTVLKKPTLNMIHKEVMVHNSYARYIGSSFNEVVPEFDRLMDNLKEVEGTI